MTQLVSLRKRLLAEWGFAAYVHDYKILYDTGLTGTALLNNMKALGISPDEPEYLVFSHRHIDHTGGLRKFLEARSKPITIVAHKNLFAKAYAKDEEGRVEEIGVDFDEDYLKRRGAELVLIEKPHWLRPDVAASGEIPRKWGPSHLGAVLDEIPDDMALYIKTAKGLVAITGCGHSGVENIVEYGMSITGADKLYALIGGLHFVGLPPERVSQAVEYIASKKPQVVVGTHCTGVLGQAELVKRLGQVAKVGGVGLTLEL
ncbi:MAG: MBL fold metallo-hydrolase [Pyrobaculum sp.]